MEYDSLSKFITENNVPLKQNINDVGVKPTMETPTHIFYIDEPSSWYAHTADHNLIKLPGYEVFRVYVKDKNKYTRVIIYNGQVVFECETLSEISSQIDKLKLIKQIELRGKVINDKDTEGDFSLK